MGIGLLLDCYFVGIRVVLGWYWIVFVRYRIGILQIVDGNPIRNALVTHWHCIRSDLVLRLYWIGISSAFHCIELALEGYGIGIWFVSDLALSWYGDCIRFALRWCIALALVLDWYWIGIGLVLDLYWIGIGLALGWYGIGTKLALVCFSISFFSLDLYWVGIWYIALVLDWRLVGIGLVLDLLRIGA